jgi:hypothetical protein
MLKILPVKQVLLTKGSLNGTPCTFIYVDEKNGTATDINDILTEVLKSKLKTVAIKGKLIDNHEIKTMIEGLISKGKVIYFETDASDNIETIRRLRNVIFCLNLQPPSSKENNVDPRNLPLLQDLDEISINLKSTDDYERAKKYLKDRLISRPTVFFSVDIEMHAEDLIELMNNYLTDAERFTFKNRLINVNRVDGIK